MMTDEEFVITADVLEVGTKFKDTDGNIRFIVIDAHGNKCTVLANSVGIPKYSVVPPEEIVVVEIL